MAYSSTGYPSSGAACYAAVKLVGVPDFLILHHSTQNNLLFIRPNGGDSEIKILSFTVGLDGKANPNAKQYYAKNQGVFDDEREVSLFLPEPCDKGMTLKVAEMKGKVVAELRYEYALNLLSRLGFSKSRVGLDFIVG